MMPERNLNPRRINRKQWGIGGHGFIVAAVFFLIITSNGCAKWQGYVGLDANLPAEADIAVDSLLTQADAEIDRSQPILIASIVNVDSLDESSTFGRMFSELLASSFVRRQYKVQEIKLRTSIFIKKRSGEFLLSRDVKTLSKKYKTNTLVVGTYALGDKTMTLSIRLIDASSGIIISGYDTVLPVGSETKVLAFQ